MTCLLRTNIRQHGVLPYISLGFYLHTQSGSNIGCHVAQIFIDIHKSKLNQKIIVM